MGVVVDSGGKGVAVCRKGNYSSERKMVLTGICCAYFPFLGLVL